MEQLEQEFRFHTEIPNWWSNVTLCFKYLPDVEGKYCTGEKLTCAKPNQYTNQFHDWSRDAGGCKLTWGLFFDPIDVIDKSHQESEPQFLENVGFNGYTYPVFSTPAKIKPSLSQLPDWFKEIILCFTYRPYTGKGLAARIACSKLNSFLPVYHDEFGHKGWLVVMSWSVFFPNFNQQNQHPRIPAWALSTRICITHYEKISNLFLKITTKKAVKCSSGNDFSYPYTDKTFYRAQVSYEESFLQWSLINTMNLTLN